MTESSFQLIEVAVISFYDNLNGGTPGCRKIGQGLGPHVGGQNGVKINEKRRLFNVFCNF